MWVFLRFVFCVDLMMFSQCYFTKPLNRTFVSGQDEASSLSIFSGEEEKFAFQRTLSRLTEMQSEEYWLEGDRSTKSKVQRSQKSTGVTQPAKVQETNCPPLRQTLLLLITAAADQRRLLQSLVQRIFIQILRPFMTLLHFMNLFKTICCWNHISFNVPFHHVAAGFTKSTGKSWTTLGFLREILILFELRNVYENKASQ